MMKTPRQKRGISGAILESLRKAANRRPFDTLDPAEIRGHRDLKMPRGLPPPNIERTAPKKFEHYERIIPKRKFVDDTPPRPTTRSGWTPLGREVRDSARVRGAGSAARTLGRGLRDEVLGSFRRKRKV
jgi:hypothetical protein